MSASTHTFRCLPPGLADRLNGYRISVRNPVKGLLQGMHRSPDFGSSVEFSEYRQYAPGDPASLIDWTVYARSDRYVIRRYEEETSLSAHMILDSSASMSWRMRGSISKFDYASMLCAALSFVLISQGDSASLRISQGAEFGSASNLETLRPALEEIDRVQPKGQTNLEDEMHKSAERLKGKNLVVVVSDFLQAPEEILRGVQHLRHDGHEVTLFHVLDRAELSLGLEGLSEVRDLETGAKLLIEAEELREVYAAEVENFLSALRRGCSGCMADYCLTDTDTPIEDAVKLRATRK